jgi:uncharacterized lipoprotein YajG
MRIRSLIPVLLVSAALLSGCGYSIKRSLPVKSVRLGRVENRTYEAKLQDRFYEALTRELTKNGIRVSKGAEHEIHGRIDALRLKSSAEQDELTVLYEITIDGEFFLKGPGGSEKRLKGTGEFIVTFTSSGELAKVMSNKETAIRQVLEDIAEEIVDSIIHD